MKSIDLNADLGEGAPLDGELLQIVSSASVACGGHAGDEQIMERTLLAAKQAGVVTGAHPGYLDKENFGRVQLDISAQKVARQVVGQLQAIENIAQKTGQPVSYVKLHGALYNRASREYDFARVIFEAIADYSNCLSVLALDNSAQIRAAQDAGLQTIAEAFADRAYTQAGLLMGREQPGAVYDRAEIAVRQAVLIARDGELVSQSGKRIKSGARSLCLHGDNEAALQLATAVRDGLKQVGIAIRAAV